MVCPACHARYEEGGAFCSRDGTPLVKDPQAGKTDLVGQVLADRYRIVRLIGEGGMGQVYEAQHVNINKRFAIKLLRPEIVSNAEAVARFRQEAWSASSIGHDNIVSMEDFATLPSGAVYLAMEFLSGAALSDRMRQTPSLTLAEALDICLQVGSGLGAAHEKSIVHRDMKPENIFIAQKHGHPLVKILDFGIAKVSGADGNKSLTRTGTIFGTPHYMSPEQALGKPLDHRADIYSVGVIMYELFAGRVPFEAESFMGILTKHITTTPTPPRALAPEMPELLETVILRAMAKEADERYQTMAELAGDLCAVAEAHAPELLVPRTSQPLASISRAASVVMGAARATPLPGRPPSGLTPLRSGQPAAAAGALASGTTPVPPRSGLSPLALSDTAQRPLAEHKRGSTLWLAVGGVLVVGVAGAVVLSTRHRPVPTPSVTPAPTRAAVVATAPLAARTTTPAVVATAPVAKPAAVELEDIIVNSIPAGAKIYVDGAAIADTPEAIKVAKGTTKTVVLKKDGFADETTTLDALKSRKVTVRLDRLKKPAAAVTSKPIKLPVPPPAPAADPPAAHPVVAHPTTTPPPPAQPPHAPVKKKYVDPYERVDEPKKGADVLNPY
jgi:serine/threonine-protein kinase